MAIVLGESVSPTDALAGLRRAFADAPRPATFTRGTCVCDECLEHGATLERYTPETLPLEAIDSPAWDPICTANDRAFAYYLPALVRWAFESDYHEQLLFHLEQPGRLDALSAPQRAALGHALWTLAEVKEAAMFGSWDLYVLERVLAKLEARDTL